MITILVLENDDNICQIISQSLNKEGYCLFNQPQTGGIVKIIRKANISKDDLISKGLLDLSDILIKYRSGDIYKALLAEVEKPLIETVLKRTEGNKVKAAKMLGINRNTLDAKIKKLEIDAQKWKI